MAKDQTPFSHEERLQNLLAPYLDAEERQGSRQ